MAFYRLNVPFRDKDAAKALGARWYAEDKYWFYKGDELPEGLRRWYGEGQNLVKIDDGSSRLVDPETGEIIENELPFADDADHEQRALNPITFSNNSGYEEYKSVSEINTMVHQIYNSTNEFRIVHVKGEVTNFDGKKGRNYYFAIKDEESLLQCFMWESTAQTALRFKLEKGQQVAIIGSLEFYREQGKTQLVVSHIENIGDGQANLMYLRLKAKLQAEGIFDDAHKKSIPKHPTTVGIITSKDGQAIKDICKVAQKRNPYVQLVLYHVNVQGVNAVATITKGIKVLDEMGLDTIIVGRGGGSDEELLVYNDERIVRLVYEADTPIVSAVGHEGHWTLIDHVADKRCATPSEAAEETIPNIMVDIERLQLISKAIKDNMQSRLEERLLVLKALQAKLEQNGPVHKYKEKSDKLNSLISMMRLNMQSAYESKAEKPNILLESIRQNMMMAYDLRCHRLEVLLTKLNGLSPTAKLINGFGYITKDDKAVTDIEMVSPGDSVSVRIHNGRFTAEVKKVGSDND